MESISTVNIYTEHEMDMIRMKIVDPITHQVSAIADTGANINAISSTTAAQYKQYIKYNHKPFRVRTGGGYISCRSYIPFTLKHPTTEFTSKCKFYIIPDLPYNYLIGRPTQRLFGYKLVHVGPTEYHHKPEELDIGYDSDDEIEQYDNPLPTMSAPITLNFDDIKISERDADLTKYIKEALQQHHDIIASDEFDIGLINFPDAEFKIEFKPNADTTPIKCAEYPLNIRYIKEIERQLK